MTTQRRAALYARISVAAEESVSIERQVEAGRQYAASRGWEVVAVFADEGVSATHNRPADRAGWRALLDSTEPYDHVIVWKLDRLARRLTDFWAAVTLLADQGRKLAAVEDHIDMSTGLGQTMAGLIAGFAQVEQEAISARVTAARRHLLSVGRWAGGAVPYGFTPVPLDGGGWVLGHDPERVEWLRGMVERVERGDTIYSVQQWLTEVGAPLPVASQGRRTSARWAYATVERIVRNPIVAGMTPHNPGSRSKVRGDDVLRGPDGLPVVSDELAVMPVARWRGMIARLDANDKPQARAVAMRSKSSPLLSGLVVCGHCDGRRMTRRTKNGNLVYQCPLCGQSMANFEDYVIEQFLDRLGDSLRLARVAEHYDAGAELLPEIEHRLKELGAQLLDTDDDAEAERLETQIRHLRAMRRDTRQRSPQVEWVPVRGERTWGADWAAAEDVQARRAILDDALDRITIRRGRRGGRGLDTSRLTFDWRVAPDADDEVVPED